MCGGAGRGWGELSQARHDNRCGDDGSGIAWPQGVPTQAHEKGGILYGGFIVGCFFFFFAW